MSRVSALKSCRSARSSRHSALSIRPCAEAVPRVTKTVKQNKPILNSRLFISQSLLKVVFRSKIAPWRSFGSTSEEAGGEECRPDHVRRKLHSFAANPACQRIRRGADSGGRNFLCWKYGN